VCFLGAVLWVVGISMLGYTCGGFDIVKNNFELVVFGIIGVSILPIIIGIFRAKMKKS